MKFHTAMKAFVGVSGASFVGLDTETLVPLTGGRKNPMQNRILKRMCGANVMVFQNKRINGYNSMVSRRLLKEGIVEEFKLSPRKWGKRIEDTPFVEHAKDGEVKHYLEVIFLNPGTSEYFLDGEPIDKKDIVGLSEHKESEQGGLENKVIVRTFSLDNLKAVRIDGKLFS